MLMQSSDIELSLNHFVLFFIHRFCDNNSVQMFDLFLECMPEYNIDKTDAEGNTPLLLAYIKVMQGYKGSV